MTTPFKVQPSPTVHTKEALGKGWNGVFLPLESLGSSLEMLVEPFLAKGAAQGWACAPFKEENNIKSLLVCWDYLGDPKLLTRN